MGQGPKKLFDGASIERFRRGGEGRAGPTPARRAPGHGWARIVCHDELASVAHLPADRREVRRVGLAYAASPAGYAVSAAIGAVVVIGGAIAASAVKVRHNQWSEVIVLRLGRFLNAALRALGLFAIVPVILATPLPYWIDIRVITSSFKAEKTLTRDTVPVDVDAVLFWKVVDAEKAALDVPADYSERGRLGHLQTGRSAATSSARPQLRRHRLEGGAARSATSFA